MRLQVLEGLGELTSLGSEEGCSEGNHGSETNPLMDGKVFVEEDESDGENGEGQNEDPDLGI